MSQLGTPEQNVSQLDTLSQSHLVTSLKKSKTQFYAETLAVEHSANTPLKHEHDSEKDEVNNGTDLNDNQPPKPSSNCKTTRTHSISSQQDF